MSWFNNKEKEKRELEKEYAQEIERKRLELEHQQVHPWSSEDQEKLDRLQKERQIALDQERMKVFTDLPEEVREAMLKKALEREIDVAYLTLDNVHVNASDEERNLIERYNQHSGCHGDYYGNVNSFLDNYKYSHNHGDRLPRYKDLLRAHTDAAIDEIILDNKGED